MFDTKLTKALLIVFVVSLGLRILYSFTIGDSDLLPDSDASHYLKSADTIVSGEGLKNDTHIRAYQPPGYFYFLAGVRKLFGANVLIIRLVQAVLGALLCVLVAILVRQFCPVLIAALAGLFAAVSPTLIHYSAVIYSEVLFMPLCLLGLLFAFRVIRTGGTILAACLCGAVFGIAALTRESAALVLIGGMAGLIATHKSWRAAMIAAVTISAAAFTILPWTLRNYQIFHKVVPISTNSGINLYFGNNPSADGEFMWILPPGTKWNEPAPAGFPLGYYEYLADRTARDSAIAWIGSEPEKFGMLCLRRLWLLLRPPIPSDVGGLSFLVGMVRLAEHVVLFGVVILLLPWSLLRKRGRGIGLLALGCLLLMLPHIFTVVQNRYRVPVFPLLIALAITMAQSRGWFDRLSDADKSVVWRRIL